MMYQNSAWWTRRENGTVEVTEIPREDWADHPSNDLVMAKYHYRWIPPYAIAQHLPNWYDLRLECDLHQDGVRRFAPVGKNFVDAHPTSPGLRHVAEIPGLSAVTSLGGHAILADRDEIEQITPFTYDEARLFLRYVQHMQEYFGKSVKLGRVLRVSPGGRISRGIKDVLPEDLGLDENGDGDRWSLSRLRKEGLQGASDAGVKSPTPDQVLQYGLLQAAIQNPRPMPQEGTRSLVRITLFTLGPSSEQVTEEHIQYVASHVKKSLAEHRDDTPEEFKSWIKDPKANLIYRISKRQDCRLIAKKKREDEPPGEEEYDPQENRTHVRKTLLELGWQTFQIRGNVSASRWKRFEMPFPFL